MNARIVAAALAVAGLGLGVGACGGAEAGPPPPPVASVPQGVGPPSAPWMAPAPTPAPAPAPTINPGPPVTLSAPAPETLITRPGMYEVGTDIRAGKWKTGGPLPGNPGWSAAVRDPDGTLVSFDFVDGPAYVTVKKGQVLTLTSGGRPAITWVWQDASS